MKSLHQRTKSQDERRRNLESNQLNADSKSGYPIWIFLIPAGFFVVSILLTGFVLVIVKPHAQTYKNTLDDDSRSIINTLEQYAKITQRYRQPTYPSFSDNNSTYFTKDGLDHRKDLLIGVLTSYRFFDSRAPAVLDTWVCTTKTK